MSGRAGNTPGALRRLRPASLRPAALRPASLRGKLTLGALVLVSLGIVVAVLTSLLGVRHYLLDSIDRELMSGRAGVERTDLDVTEAEALVTVADLGGDLDPRTAAAAQSVTGHYAVIVLLDDEGRPRQVGVRPPTAVQRGVAAAVTDPAALLAADRPHQVTADGVHYRITAVRLRSGEVVLMATSTKAVWATIAKIVKLELAVGAVLIAVLGFATYRSSARRLRPLEDMVETASAIAEASPDAASLSRRVAGRDGAATASEVEQLRTALNAMLHQVETAFVTREHAADQLRRFVADASHELRTPLSAIRGYLQLYDKGMLADEAERARALGRMTAETERMARLVDELLALTRLDQQPVLRPRDVDLAAVVTEALADLRAQQPDRPITLDLAVPDCRAHVDEGVLRQITGNLLANVRAHTPPDAEVTVHLGVRPDVHRDWAVLRIADRGPGLPPEDAERVFDRFFRTAGSSGSGLGMSIVRAGAESQGGTVHLTTAPGQGLTATVLLPRTTSVG